MSKKQNPLYSETLRLVSLANKRIARMTKAGKTSEFLTKNNIKRFSVKDKTDKELQKEQQLIKKFINSKDGGLKQQAKINSDSVQDMKKAMQSDIKKANRILKRLKQKGYNNTSLYIQTVKNLAKLNKYKFGVKDLNDSQVIEMIGILQNFLNSDQSSIKFLNQVQKMHPTDDGDAFRMIMDAVINDSRIDVIGMDSDDVQILLREIIPNKGDLRTKTIEQYIETVLEKYKKQLEAEKRVLEKYNMPIN